MYFSTQVTRYPWQGDGDVGLTVTPEPIPVTAEKGLVLDLLKLRFLNSCKVPLVNFVYFFNYVILTW